MHTVWQAQINQMIIHLFHFRKSIRLLSGGVRNGEYQIKFAAYSEGRIPNLLKKHFEK